MVLRRYKILVIVFLVFIGANAQTDAQSVLGLPQVTNAQMNAILAPQLGSVVFNTDEQTIYRYISTGWVADDDQQQLGLLGTSLSIENGNSVDLASLKSFYNDHPWDNPDGSVATQTSTSINFSGNVGIGVADPQQSIDITGTARIRGLVDENVNSNKVLVVDANGVVKQNDASNLAAGEWGDAANLGQSDFIYAKQAKSAGYDIVITDNGKLNVGMQTMLPEDFEPYGHLNVFNYDDRKFPVTITNSDADFPAYIFFDQEGGGSDEVMIGADYDTFGAAIYTNMSRILLGFDEQSAVTIHKANKYMGIGEMTPTAALDIATGPIPLRIRGLADTAITGNKILVADASGYVKQTQSTEIVTTSKVIYPPKAPIVVTTTGTGFTFDLYQSYSDALGTPIAKSPSAGTLNTHTRTELEYHIVDLDTAVFSNITVNDNGVMTYDVISVPSGNLSHVTCVFQLK